MGGELIPGGPGPGCPGPSCASRGGALAWGAALMPWGVWVSSCSWGREPTTHLWAPGLPAPRWDHDIQGVLEHQGGRWSLGGLGALGGRPGQLARWSRVPKASSGARLTVRFALLEDRGKRQLQGDGTHLLLHKEVSAERLRAGLAALGYLRATWETPLPWSAFNPENHRSRERPLGSLWGSGPPN